MRGKKVPGIKKHNSYGRKPLIVRSRRLTRSPGGGRPVVRIDDAMPCHAPTLMWHRVVSVTAPSKLKYWAKRIHPLSTAIAGGEIVPIAVFSWGFGSNRAGSVATSTRTARGKIAELKTRRSWRDANPQSGGARERTVLRRPKTMSRFAASRR